MLYLLKVDALIAAFVFAGAGLMILALLAWQEAKASVAALHRIYKRVMTLITQPQFFASPVAISRSFSRSSDQAGLASHKSQ
jgi:ABC-type polysaccharide/polyol phosphate export permease